MFWHLVEVVLFLLTIAVVLEYREKWRKEQAARPLSSQSPTKVLEVEGNGREVFTPLLEWDRVYKLSITGTCRFGYSCCERIFYADAVFETDKHGNYAQRHGKLFVNGRLVTVLQDWQEDRARHVYSGFIEGSGQRVPIQFYCPPGPHTGESDAEYKSGSLRARIELQTGLLSQAAKRRNESEADGSRQKAAELATEEEKRRKAVKQRQIQERVKVLNIQVQQQRNFCSGSAGNGEGVLPVR